MEARISSPTKMSDIPSTDKPTGVLGFCLEARNEGEEFIRRQPNHSKIDETMKAIMGEDAPSRPKGLSQTYANELGRIARVKVALLTDTRPFWEYRTFNPTYEETARSLGKLAQQWYTGPMAIDQKWSDVVRYSLVGGTGWGWQLWNPDRQDIDVVPKDVRDVLPFRCSSSYIQDALGVMVKETYPLEYVMERWPQAAQQVKASRSGLSETGDNTRLQKLFAKIPLGPFERSRLLKGGAHTQPLNFPTVDVFYFYFHDPAINESGSMGDWIKVGQFDGLEPLNNWSYLVPPGQPLYPRKRCVVFTETAVLYDGPSFYWHDQYPVTKLTLDPWPWTWIGMSSLWDLLPLQDSLTKSLRARDDHIEKVLRPNVAADNQSISKSELRKYDTRKGGQKVLISAFGQGLKEQEVKPLDKAVGENIEFCLERMQLQSGIADFSQLGQLGQAPSANAIDAMMQAMTPEVRGQSRALEVSVRDFATQFAYNVAQWYSVKRRYTILGPDGVTPDDFDFDPATFIPAFTDSDYDDEGHIRPGAIDRPRPRLDRAREFLRHFTFNVRPGSLLKSAASADQMMYLQLARMNYIDIQTLLEKLDIPNAGNMLEGSVLERLAKQMQAGLGPSVGPAGASAAGRKASGQAPPSMRDDGVITESE
jgi:hypothetical protein